MADINVEHCCLLEVSFVDVARLCAALLLALAFAAAIKTAFFLSLFFFSASTTTFVAACTIVHGVRVKEP
jgi:hypothetical protein